MDTELLQELGRSGLLGVLLALALAWIYNLHKQINMLQNKRVSDATAVTDKMLELNDKWNDTIREQVKAVESMEATMRRLEIAASRSH